MLLGAKMSTDLTMKCTKQHGGRRVRCMSSEQVLTRWRCLVAFKKARNILRQVMRTVSYRRTATAIKMVSKVDTVCILVLFAVALAAAGAIWSE